MTTNTEAAAYKDLDHLLRLFFPKGRPHAYIDGDWSASAQSTATVNPSTGDTIAQVPLNSSDEVAYAINAAGKAQSAWAALTVEERILHLKAFSQKLELMGDELALLESYNSGNPLRATRRDIQFGLKYLDSWPSYAIAEAGKATRPYTDGISITTRKPYGVVGRIVAYNHPLLFAVAGAIFPLLAGNTIVIKAPEQDPLSMLALGAIATDTLPAGVFNLVSGDADTGDAIVTDPAVKRLSFVGSGVAARKIQTRLSKSGIVKHFTTELGGKNAMIVCADVDLNKTVDAAISGMSFRISQGQSCQATSRLLIHRDIFSEFVSRMSHKMKEMTIGPAYDETNDMGPIVSEQQLQHINSFLDSNLPPEAQIVTGGQRVEVEGVNGFYYPPTLVVGASSDSAICQEEIFGPVVVALPWDTEREAVEIANDTELGLTAAVWSRDIDQALRFAVNLDVGYIWVNDANRHYPGAPFGGMKNSGVGREECSEELLSYSELSTINIRFNSEFDS